MGVYFFAAVALADELLDVGLRLLAVLPEEVPVPEEDGEPNFGLVPVVAPGLVDPDVPGLALDDGDPNFGLAPVVEDGLVLRVGELKLGFLAAGGLLLLLGELKLLLGLLLLLLELLLPLLLRPGLADASKARPPTKSRHTSMVSNPRRFIVLTPFG